MGNVIGEVIQSRSNSAEWNIQWTIDFSKIEEIKIYESPSFSISDSTWFLRMGVNRLNPGISLWLKNWGIRKWVTYSFGVKTADGTVQRIGDEISREFHDFSFTPDTKFFTISELRQRESELAPSGHLTLTCDLWLQEEPINCLSTVTNSSREAQLEADPARTAKDSGHLTQESSPEQITCLRREYQVQHDKMMTRWEGELEQMMTTLQSKCETEEQKMKMHSLYDQMAKGRDMLEEGIQQRAKEAKEKNLLAAYRLLAAKSGRPGPKTADFDAINPSTSAVISSSLEEQLEADPARTAIDSGHLTQQSSPEQITCTRREFQGLNQLSTNFKELFVFKRFCDAKLKVKNEEFSVHRGVLAVRSPVFKALFEADMKEKRTGVVDIPDCHPGAFRIFLTYIYSGMASGDLSKNVFDLYRIADKYAVEELKLDCIHYVTNNLSVDNLFDAAILGHQFGERELSSKVQAFFNEHSKEVFLHGNWSSFMTEHPALVKELLLKMSERN